jgi:hypothetical protein
MTAIILGIESLPLRCLLWTVWFPVVAIEMAAMHAVLGIARLACGISYVFFTLLALYFAGIAGSRRNK